MILLDESQHITERWQDRENGFMEDLKSSLDRGDALPEWQGAQFTCGEVKKRWISGRPSSWRVCSGGWAASRPRP